MAQKPVLDSHFKSIACPPPSPSAPARKKWIFSFRYWREIEFFGFNRTNSGWFVSLLERLADLSNEDLDRFTRDRSKKNALRYHKIDWGQKNIPIQRSEFVWLPKDILENEEELPFLQFQLSKSLGRVVGFWDRDFVFNILLLDPFHNIQPSKHYDYRVDPCSPLCCDYTKLLISIDAILDSQCYERECEVAARIKSIRTTREYLQDSNVIVLKITDDEMDFAKLLVEQKKIKTIRDLILDGLKYHINS
jgi:hypothetical protein